MKQQKTLQKRIYLVTGVAGYLGSNVAKSLLEQGKKVRGLVLKGDPAMAQVHTAAFFFT